MNEEDNSVETPKDPVSSPEVVITESVRKPTQAVILSIVVVVALGIVGLGIYLNNNVDEDTQVVVVPEDQTS